MLGADFAKNNWCFVHVKIGFRDHEGCKDRRNPFILQHLRLWF